MHWLLCFVLEKRIKDDSKKRSGVPENRSDVLEKRVLEKLLDSHSLTVVRKNNTLHLTICPEDDEDEI